MLFGCRTSLDSSCPLCRPFKIPTTNFELPKLLSSRSVPAGGKREQQRRMATTTPTVRHGSCLCKAVKYEVTGDPFTFVVCHCVNCRKVSGSAFLNNGFFKQQNVVITRGNDTIKSHPDTDTKSGRTLMRWFCPSCGSSLFLNTEDATFTIVCVGTIDDDFPWMPRKEMFPECQRPWVQGIKVIPKAKKAKL